MAAARAVYAEELRRLAELCEGLNILDGADADDCIVLSSGIKVTDKNGDAVGVLRDEVGGAWCFEAVIV